MSDAPAVDYALQIIEFIANSSIPVGISEISRETGINKNAVSRVLNSLANHGWVYSANENAKYQLTLKPFRITGKALTHITMHNIALPYLREVWEKTGDSSYVGILNDNYVLYIQHIDSVHDLKIAGRIGGMYELHCAAAGKVLLAYSGSEFQRAYCKERLIKKTDRTIIDPVKMLEHLGQIRKQGFATDLEEYSYGILCVAAPIFNCSGEIEGAIGISTSTVYRNEQSLLKDEGVIVCRAASEISNKLGYSEYMEGKK